MRLIDADKLKTHYSWWTDETKELFDTIINLQPTIEAEPVRHGKWIFIERREPQYDILGVKTWGIAYRCSECGFVHSVIEDFGHYTFCPGCGAKIDEIDEVEE